MISPCLLFSKFSHMSGGVPQLYLYVCLSRSMKVLPFKSKYSKSLNSLVEGVEGSSTCIEEYDLYLCLYFYL